MEQHLEKQFMKLNLETSSTISCHGIPLLKQMETQKQMGPHEIKKPLNFKSKQINKANNQDKSTHNKVEYKFFISGL